MSSVILHPKSETSSCYSINMLIILCQYYMTEPHRLITTSISELNVEASVWVWSGCVSLLISG
eukprot:gnl/Chilomastix_caulleri/8474.p1 GENE.gnl/Chilomastix_caulleri/8474~~gnl/Chilomastix_caulleri/8474.p1  ORF type:complete len:63 (-),score=0.80 gnl/Chilomastix_caulleri/8474:68-256(-)